MKASILLTAFLLFILTASAQNQGTIHGKAYKNQKAAEGATASLLRAKDSSTIKLTVVNKEGIYSFEKVIDGKYIVSITAVGYRKAISGIIEISQQQQHMQVPELSLTAVSKELGGVTINAKRPLIEQRIDRTIVNVDASITNIGTSAMEVLEKSPGVSVDREGNISLKGKEGVLVMVDGRPTQLGGADLANLLRNMSSNQLDQIEIVTNPPARYDAAGTSGIINIKTKKIVTAGYNGLMSVGYSLGRYPKTNEAFNFNYREGKINLFSNLSHNYRKGFGALLIQRKLFNNNTNEVEKLFDQRSDRIAKSNFYNAKVGMDFFATKKTTLGIVLNGTTNNFSSDNVNVTNIYNPSKDLENVTKASIVTTGEWNNFNANLNFRSVLDKKGNELTSDVDFLTYRSQNDQSMVNAFFDASGNPFVKSDTLLGDLPQKINVYSGRIDYLHPINKKARFEAGFKSSIAKTDNNANYDSIQYGALVHDYNRSNHFVYEENINAAYVNASTSLSKKITAQFGLRVENTNAKGKQLTTGEKFDRHYTQLFPTAYFQYKANDKNNFGANFGRRVRRPNYQSLNPFIKFIDRYTYTTGNPNLKPSVSSNFELSHTWKSRITTTMNYTITKDIIDEVIEQRGQEAYRMPANLSSLYQYGISVSANTPVTKWWTSNINVNAFNNNVKGIVSKAPIELTTTSFIINTLQQFQLSKTLTAEVNGRYRNGWLEGVMRAKRIGFVGAGLSKQLWKGKGSVRVSVRDIFYTQKFRGESKYGNVDFNFQDQNETRVGSLAFTYRFSKGKKVAPVKRTKGSLTEELDRIPGE